MFKTSLAKSESSFFRKTLSFAMAFIIALSSLSMMAIKADAATTLSTAVSWLHQQATQSNTNYQCVIFVQAYIRQFFPEYSSMLNGGHASAWQTKAIPSGWQSIYTSNVSQVQEGDILALKGGTEYGHVAVAVRHNGTMRMVDANGGYTLGTGRGHYNLNEGTPPDYHNISGLIRIVRPAYQSSSPSVISGSKFIINQYSGRALNVIGSTPTSASYNCGSGVEYGNVTDFTLDWSSTQTWTFHHLGNNIYVIKCGGYALNVHTSYTPTAGKNVTLYHYDSSDACQKWKAIKNSNGTYTFLSVANTSLALAVNTSTNLGYGGIYNVYVTTYNSGYTTQQWSLIN